MPAVKIIWFLALMLAAKIVFAQPVITPKRQPIILRLDPTGMHHIVIDSLATISNPTDSALRYKFIPAFFDCSTTGKKSVYFAAYTNGYHPTQTDQYLNFQQACGIGFDNAGNYYVADNGNEIIRKITPQGLVTIAAGQSKHGGYKDGQADSSLLSLGADGNIFVDDDGTIYFSDAGNNRIRKITVGGQVVTVAGNDRRTLIDGKGNMASFNTPGAITMDKQHNLYICDSGNKVVRKITPDGTVITLAGFGHGSSDAPGGGAASFRNLYGIAVDSDGNVYVAENSDYAPGYAPSKSALIRKITPQGYVSTYFDPSKSDPDFNNFNINYYGLKFDGADNLYMGCSASLKKLTHDGKLLTVAGMVDQYGDVGGPAANARFTSIIGIDFDPCGNLILTDAAGGIKRVSTNGYVTKIAGNGGFRITGYVNASTCQGAQTNIPVKVESVPTILNSFTDVNLNNCANLANYAIKAMVADNCPGNKVTVIQTPAPNSAIFNNIPVKVTLTATDTTGGSTSTSFIVTARYTASPPGRSVSVSTSKTAICVGESVTFTADIVNGDTSTSYQWLVNGINAGTNQPTFTTNNLANGDVVNCAATTGTGCGIPNLGFPVTISVDSLPTIKLQPKADIKGGDGLLLNPVVTGNIVSYRWAPPTGLSDPTAQSPLAHPENTTTYTLTVTTTNGCTAQSSETINVINTVIVPNTFSPNGDGINDLWTIDHLSDYLNATVKVYNRNGVLVFESKGYASPWNGTRNGFNLPVGAYYYIIDLKNGGKPQSGEVTLIR